VDNIKGKIMVTEQTTFIKDLTKGLYASVIFNKCTSPSTEATVDLLSRVSFHKEALSEASRTLICQQTVSAMQNIDISKIKEESHKTLYALATYHRTRIVAAMISDIDTVFAGILVLQLSLAQIATARTRRRNVVYWNPNGRSSMISCAIKSFKRHSQGMSLYMVCVFVF